MAAGSIIVELLMKTGTFETDTQRARKSLQNEFDKMKSAATDVAKALGVALTAVAFKDLIASSIEAEAHLDDLSKKTGIAADTLGGIGFAAQQSGGDLDSASAAAGKLNKSLAEAAAGNATAAEAFKVLGINVKDAAGNTKTADTALSEIATKFASYADGPEKAALALRIFGKAGADIIPLLDEGGAKLRENIAFYKQYSGVTNETAKASKEFESTLTQLSLIQGSFGKDLAQSFLPTLQAVSDAFLDMKKNSDAMAEAAGGLGQLFSGLTAILSGFAFVVYQTGKAIGAIAAASDAFDAAQGSQYDGFSINTQEMMKAGEAYKAAAGPLKEFAADFEDAANKAADFQKKVRGATDATQLSANAFLHSDAGYGSTATGKPPAPRLSGAGTGALDDPSKKLFENQLKALEAFVSQEKDILQSRNHFLDLYNTQGLLSIQSYFDARQTINNAALSAELSAVDKEIALAKKRIASPGISEVNKADAQGKLEELTRRRAKIEQQAGEEGLTLAFQQQQAYKALADSILSVTAQVEDLHENFRLAAAIKFDQQFDALSKTFTANGNAAGLQAIATLKAAALAQADFQKASLDAGRTLDALANTEARIALAQETGGLTSLDVLVKTGEARRAQIPILEQQVAAEEAIAKASGNPALIANAEAARLALDKLKASADPLAESLNKTFGGDLNSALDDFVTGTKSASQAFSSFAKSVLNDILKMGSKSIAESLIGGSGGAGGLISSLFSNGSAQGTASASGGLLSSFASLFSGFFADGGTIPPGKFGVVGERGPEIAFGGQSGQSIRPISGGSTQNINVSVQGAPNQSRDSAMQQGAAIGLGIQKALARNT